MFNKINQKKILIITAIIITFFIFLEIIFRFVFFSKHEVRKGYDINVLKKIYGNEKAYDYKIVLEEQNKIWSYKPYLEHIESSRNGKFVSVSKDNVRCNINNEDKCLLKHGKKIIWVFGGSTTFGYGVKNDETIPAYLSKILQEYEVINLGSASYYSTHERIYFNNLITQNIYPEVAIFIDGLNDYFYYEVPDKTAVSDTIKQKQNFYYFLNDSLRKFLKKSKFLTWFNYKISGTNTSNLANYSISDSMLKKVEDRLLANFIIRSEIAKKYNIKIINVIQPVPGFGLGHTNSNVPKNLIKMNEHVNSGRGYRIMDLSRFQTNDSNLLNLSNLSIVKPMYIDTVHYSPEFNLEIAKNLARKLVTK